MSAYYSIRITKACNLIQSKARNNRFLRIAAPVEGRYEVVTAGNKVVNG